MNLAHTNTARTAEITDSASLVAAILAEVARARAALRSKPEDADRALEVVTEMLTPEGDVSQPPPSSRSAVRGALPELDELTRHVPRLAIARTNLLDNLEDLRKHMDTAAAAFLFLKADHGKGAPDNKEAARLTRVFIETMGDMVDCVSCAHSHVEDLIAAVEAETRTSLANDDNVDQAAEE